MNIFVFDIETVPDVASARRLWNLSDLDDDAVAAVMYNKRQQETSGGTTFMRHYLHQIVAISVAFRNDDRFKLWSLGEEDSSEEEIVRRFFEGIERYTPTLVSWNGGGFDMPVLHYRALFHGVCAPQYWDTGNENPSFRYNNYLGRFHWRHIDLMDVLSGYQPRAFASLDQIAGMLGFPGKLDMTGSGVEERFRAGDLKAIRDYCETDVLNTYLIFLKFQHMRGELQVSQLQEELERVRKYLVESGERHLANFLASWDQMAMP